MKSKAFYKPNGDENEMENISKGKQIPANHQKKR